MIRKWFVKDTDNPPGQVHPPNTIIRMYQNVLKDVKEQLKDPASPLSKWWEEEFKKPRCPHCGQYISWEDRQFRQN